MSDSTVSALTAASTLDGSELYYGVQGGNDRKVTGTQIKALTSASPTLVTPVLGVATATSINKVTITAPGTSATLTLVTGSSLITVGAFAITFTSTGTTGVTLPTTGTLATRAGAETLTNKTLTAPVLTTPVLGVPASGDLSNCTFPDSDPHVAGAGYWTAGVLTKSAG